MNKKGFTLVELLAVIAIIGILAVILVPNVVNMFVGAKQDIFLDEVKTVYREINKLYLAQGVKNVVVTKVNNVDNVANDGSFQLTLNNPDIKYKATIEPTTGNITSLYVKNGINCVNIDTYKNVEEIDKTDIDVCK